MLRKHSLWALATTIAGAILILLIMAGGAMAQSPSPSWYMTDVNTNHGFPSGANGGVIEGLGMLGSSCDYAPYTQSDVESEAVSWIDAGHDTIIEVTPQTGCDSSIGDYESLLLSMRNYIHGHVSSGNFTRYWGGFMLDEEPWYWNDSASSSYSAFTALNQYAVTYTNDATYGPYSELANASGWWSQAQYNNVAFVSGFTAAPQVYNTFMTNAQNSLVGTYGADAGNVRPEWRVWFVLECLQRDQWCPAGAGGVGW